MSNKVTIVPHYKVWLPQKHCQWSPPLCSSTYSSISIFPVVDLCRYIRSSQVKNVLHGNTSCKAPYIISVIGNKAFIIKRGENHASTKRNKETPSNSLLSESILLFCLSFSCPWVRIFQESMGIVLDKKSGIGKQLRNPGRKLIYIIQGKDRVVKWTWIV